MRSDPWRMEEAARSTLLLLPSSTLRHCCRREAVREGEAVRAASREEDEACGCGIAARGRGLREAPTAGRGRGRELGFGGGRTRSDGAWGSAEESRGHAGRAGVRLIYEEGGGGDGGPATLGRGERSGVRRGGGGGRAAAGPAGAGRAVPCQPTGLSSGPGTACCLGPGQPGPACYRAVPCSCRAKKTCLGLHGQV